MRRSIVSALGFVAGLGSLASGQALEQEYVTPTLGTSTQQFGYGVATQADVMVAGAPRDDSNGPNAGAAYVYRWDAATASWAYEAQLFPTDPEIEARFGISAAVYGDVAVIGASLEDNAKGTNAGAAYIFRRDSSTGVWSQEQKLTPSVGAGYDEFGLRLALVDDVLLVSAHLGNTANGVDSGLVYVYRWKDSTVNWVEEATLVDPDGKALDYAGSGIAFDGATAVIGSPGEQQGSNPDAGTVGIWTVSGTTWTQAAELSPLVRQDYAYFGYAVGVSGTELVVGAPYFDTSGTFDVGACYFFSNASGSWTETGLITNPNSKDSDSFGFRAAMSGKLAIVGSYNDDAFGRLDSGAAYTFRKGNGNKGWFLDQELAASDGAAFDYFCTSLAASDEHIVIGAPGNEISSGGFYTDWGVVYGFDADEINLKINPTQPMPGETMNISIYDGEENAPVLLVVDEVDGTPVWVEVLFSSFGVDHRLTFDADAENPLLGFNIGVTAWKISPTGPVVSSSRVYVDV